jgi:hypothetical protein
MVRTTRRVEIDHDGDLDVPVISINILDDNILEIA